jgi:hypothetical protein
VTTDAEALPRPGRWLAVLALVYVVGHHTGTALAPLGRIGPTRWADWVDLLLPYALLGSAAMVLTRAGAPRATWVVLGVGAVVYAQGHGIHLAANSIGNEVGHAPVITLWDEHVGHYVWYLGVALVAAALVLGVPELRPSRTGWVLAGLVALTLTTNAIEGQSVPLSAALAVGFVVRGRLLAVRAVYGAHLVLLVLWVAYWALAEGRWSPEFTELGWA